MGYEARMCAMLATIVALAVFYLVVLSPAVNKWEKNAGYPYGKMCNSIFTGYVDTCNH